MFMAKKTILYKVIWLLGIILANSSYALINAEIFKTPNDIEVILLQDPTTNLISCNLGFKGAGAIADAPNQSGLGFIMMNLIFRSEADGMDRHAKARKIKELGIDNEEQEKKLDEYLLLPTFATTL